MSDARAVPFACPYCGDEDLRPHESTDYPHSAWLCRGCRRAFTVKLLGIEVRA